MKYYFVRTRETRDFDATEFLPRPNSFQDIKLKKYVQQDPADVVTILSKPTSKTLPIL